jgi:DNA polymerase-3 subunit alpha
MAATLSSDMDNTDKVHIFYLDTLAQGISILPPDINSSVNRFMPVDEKTIAYGLEAIKGTGKAAIDSIEDARNLGGPFRDLFDFCHRVDKRVVNRRATEALIRSGAFDKISDHRHQLLASLEVALCSAEQKAQSINQNSLFEDDASVTMSVQVKNVPRWTLREQLQHEKTSLGFYLSGHPYQEYANELENFVKTRLADITLQALPQNGNNKRGGVPVVLAGIVSAVRIQQTRRGRMAIVTLDDGSAQLEMMVFNEVFEANRPWIREDELLVVRGKASLDEYSGNMRVNGEELFDFASARSNFAKRLELTVSSDARISVTELKELLKPYEGKCMVLVCYRNTSGSVNLKLSESWCVTLSNDLISGLKKLLGEQNVHIAYS